MHLWKVDFSGLFFGAVLGKKVEYIKSTFSRLSVEFSRSSSALSALFFMSSKVDFLKCTKSALKVQFKSAL